MSQQSSMQTDQDSYCSQISSAAGEPLTGSAPVCPVFFLLEFNGAWESKALEASNLPDAIKNHLAEANHALPGSKTLLIRRRSPASVPGISFYVATSHPDQTALYAFSLADYPELLALDLRSIARHAPEYQAYQQTSPLFLVCTHGRRDRCCAKFGLPVFNELQRLVGDRVWQCSHVGGHRFAANLFLMPHGLLFGRMRVESTAELVSRIQRGQLLLENLRGRSAFPAEAQAGEILLRERTGKIGLDDYRLLEIKPLEPKTWQVNFLDRTTGNEHSLQVIVEKSTTAIYESCALDKQTPLTRYSSIW